MRRISTLFLILLIVSMLSAYTAQAQSQGQDCSYLVLNHKYVGHFNGFINLGSYFGASGLGLAPNGGAGTLTFLPNGKVINVETIAIGMVALNKNLEIKGDFVHARQDPFFLPLHGMPRFDEICRRMNLI